MSTDQGSRAVSVRLPWAIEEAAAEWCAAHGRTLSQAMIVGLLEYIGRTELQQHVRPPGRPKAEAADLARIKRARRTR